ncbi:MAG: Protein RcsF [Tardiphaga sp.]|jgi:putative phosphonate metabolism protein|nr:Protein RcsF [Tardiphaga sp.]
MTDFPRYAIYYAPPASSPLARFGAELLGYDALTGHDTPFPAAVVAAFADWSELTRDPRKYGFHGTLKAPFVLKPDVDEAALIAACDRFAVAPRAIPVITPVVRAISGFIAVVPAEPLADLKALAQHCVEAFDGFRAPMTAADRARRKPELLTPRQVEQLDRFGYPYVRDDFRFHMTLTGRLLPQRNDDVLAMLQTRFAALAIAALPIDRIVLFRQNDALSRFRIVHEAALT